MSVKFPTNGTNQAHTSHKTRLDGRQMAVKLVKYAESFKREGRAVIAAELLDAAKIMSELAADSTR